jgi:hypothetical protein
MLRFYDVKKTNYVNRKILKNGIWIYVLICLYVSLNLILDYVLIHDDLYYGPVRFSGFACMTHADVACHFVAT